MEVLKVHSFLLLRPNFVVPYVRFCLADNYPSPRFTCCSFAFVSLALQEQCSPCQPCMSHSKERLPVAEDSMELCGFLSFSMKQHFLNVLVKRSFVLSVHLAFHGKLWKLEVSPPTNVACAISCVSSFSEFS